MEFMGEKEQFCFYSMASTYEVFLEWTEIKK